MRRPPFIVLLVASLAALALGLAGCGGGEEVSPLPETIEGTVPEATTQESPAAELEGNADDGEQIFAASCGACHALEAANTSGNVGPNLDESQPSFELAVDRVTNGAGAMPAFEGQLTDQQIADVSAYVAESTSG